MNPIVPHLSRRTLLRSSTCGFGYLAFAGLSTWAAQKHGPLDPKPSHFPARAKRVIFLCMEGAPSHVDTFDYKPKLAERDGKSMPNARTFGKILASPFKFAKHGKGDLWISELFPELASQADELCLLRRHAHRRAGPFAGVHAAAYGSLAVPPSLNGCVDLLRTGHGE